MGVAGRGADRHPGCHRGHRSDRLSGPDRHRRHQPVRRSSPAGPDRRPRGPDQQRVRRLAAPRAREVKAFNTLYEAYIAANPRHQEGLQLLVLAGDDADAKHQVAELVERFGFAPLDIGGLRDGGRLMQLGGPSPPSNRAHPLAPLRRSPETDLIGRKGVDEIGLNFIAVGHAGIKFADASAWKQKPHLQTVIERSKCST